MRETRAELSSDADLEARQDDPLATGPRKDALNAAADAALDRQLGGDEFLGMTLPPAGTRFKLLSADSALVKSGTIELQEIGARHVKMKIHIVTVFPLPNMNETDIVDVAPNGEITMTQNKDDPQKLLQTEKPGAARNRMTFKNEKNKNMSFEWNAAKQVLTVVSPKATLTFGPG